jgi:hypothetical protein
MGQDFENFDNKPPQDDRMVAPEIGEQPKPAAVAGSALSQEELDRLSEDIIAALKTVHDPEIPADIYELGLIYKVDVDDDRNVTVDMTLTTAGLPRCGRDADLGGERRLVGRGRQACRGEPDLQPAVGHEPHVGRSTHRAGHVLTARPRYPSHHSFPSRISCEGFWPR